MSGQTALDGVNVLDLSESIGGAYCTKLLADLGASIVLVERPGSGHPLRETGPFSGEPDIERSGLFLYYGANKKSLVCDIETESGQSSVRDLASQADVVVESFAPHRIHPRRLNKTPGPHPSAVTVDYVQSSLGGKT